MMAALAALDGVEDVDGLADPAGDVVGWVASAADDGLDAVGGDKVRR